MARTAAASTGHSRSHERRRRAARAAATAQHALPESDARAPAAEPRTHAGLSRGRVRRVATDPPVLGHVPRAARARPGAGPRDGPRVALGDPGVLAPAHAVRRARAARPAPGGPQGRLPDQPVRRRHRARDAGRQGRRSRGPGVLDSHRRAGAARLTTRPSSSRRFRRRSRRMGRGDRCTSSSRAR